MKILTAAPSGSPEWLAARRGKIGGTLAVAIICGGDPDLRTFDTPYTAWLKLTGRIDDDQDDNEILRWGRKSERLHRELLEEDTGGVCEGPPGVVQDDELPWLAVSIDGFITIGGQRHVLETKAPMEWTRDEWKEGAPVTAKVQAAAGMRVANLDQAVVSALIPPAPCWQRVERDPKFEAHMIDLLGHFWEKHVLADIPPRVTGKAVDKRATARAHPKDNGQSIDLPKDLEQDFHELEHFQAVAKSATAEVETRKNRIAAAIGPNTEGVCGQFAATYKHQSRDAYWVKATEFRVLRTKRI